MRRIIPYVLILGISSWSCSRGRVGPALPQASFTSAAPECGEKASCDAVVAQGKAEDSVAEPTSDSVTSNSNAGEVTAPVASVPEPTPTPTLTPIPKAPEPTIVSYSFQVNIVSGSLMGKSFKGSFSYDPKLATGADPQIVTDTAFQFNYLIGTELVLDAPAKITVIGGKATQLTVVGGPQGKRFGINLGFDRNQFGLESEAFVRNGEQYFGYLNANGFVDGAGRVAYLLEAVGP